ncbi:MAG TPA: hypothetical protein VD838_04720 [Anaeromyxobacteraceae bacterium]|nr:hypothetical protein [Anaeromyxobacteraceae bacterium]
MRTDELARFRVVIREDGRLDVAGPDELPPEKSDLFSGELALSTEEEAARVVAAIDHYVRQRLTTIIGRKL